jgi:hypothetical protein
LFLTPSRFAVDPELPCRYPIAVPANVQIPPVSSAMKVALTTIPS